MRQTFLPSGRVKYFPLCDYKGDFQFESILTGQQYDVKVNRRLVDCTILKTSVPATHTPNFSVDDSIPFIPINDLVNIKTPPIRFFSTHDFD